MAIGTATLEEQNTILCLVSDRDSQFFGLAMSKPPDLLPQKLRFVSFVFFCFQKNIGPTGKDKNKIEIKANLDIISLDK